MSAAERYRSLNRILLLCMLLAGGWVLLNYALSRYWPALSVPCLSLRWTGQPCPMCGMTRAVMRLLRGDIGAAMQFHPLAPLLLGLLGLEAAWRVGAAVRPLAGTAARWVPRVDGLVHSAIGLAYAVYVLWFVFAGR